MVIRLERSMRSRVLIRDQRAEHRDRGEQPVDITEDDAGLFAVGGDDHDRAPLAGTQISASVAEAGEIDGGGCEDE